MIRKRNQRKERFNLLFPIQMILRNNISPYFFFPFLSTLISTLTSFSLHHSLFFVSLPHALPPKYLCPSTAASLFHSSIHSSTHHHHRLRRFTYPHASAGLVPVNRHKLMGESGFSNYQASVSETIRAHTGPMSGSIAVKRCSRNPHDVVLDEAKVVLASQKIDRVGDKWFRFITCCKEICGASHASSGSYSYYKFFIDMAVRRLTEYIDDVMAKYLSVGDPESCEKLEKMLMRGAISNSESSQIASLANCVPRVGGLIADQLIEHSETGLKTI